MSRSDIAFSAVFNAIISVGLSLIVGIILFKLCTVKGKASTPIAYGRKWLAWVLLLSSVTTLPRYFTTTDSNIIIYWLLFTGVEGVAALLIGWLYGKISLSMRKSKLNQSNQPNISIDEDRIISNSAMLNDKILDITKNIGDTKNSDESPGVAKSISNKLNALKILLEKKEITQEEHDDLRKSILITNIKTE